MDPITVAACSWLIQEAGGVLFDLGKQYLTQRMGLTHSAKAEFNQSLLDEYLQRLVTRLDEDRIAKLYGAFSLLHDASQTSAGNALLQEALANFHEVANLPRNGHTGGRPNSELRCLAYLGMASVYTAFNDKQELIAEKMVEATYADAAVATRWLGSDLVTGILAQRMALLGVRPELPTGHDDNASSIADIIQNRGREFQLPISQMMSVYQNDYRPLVAGAFRQNRIGERRVQGGNIFPNLYASIMVATLVTIAENQWKIVGLCDTPNGSIIQIALPSNETYVVTERGPDSGTKTTCVSWSRPIFSDAPIGVANRFMYQLLAGIDRVLRLTKMA